MKTGSIKTRYLLLLAVVTSAIIPLQAQDLTGFQKLRGEVLSSEPDDPYTRHAYNAFDTNRDTYFRAKDLHGGWIGLDLKNRYVIKKIRVFPRFDRTERMLGCIFQGANTSDFNNPTDLYTVTEIPEANRFVTYDISSESAFRYVRCISPNDYCNMSELEFYGEQGIQPLDFPQLTNLPTIHIETKGNFDFINKKNYVPAKIAVSTASSKNVYDAQVHGRGNSTWMFMEKKPFKIKFDTKQHFLGFPANSKHWTLIACAVDKSFIRNGLAFEMSQFLGFEYTPPCAFVDVVLDGFYYGTYMASDRIDVNKDRVDITEMNASDTGPITITGGYHLEIDAYANEEPWHFWTDRGVPFTVQSPDDDVIVPAQFNWIRNYINQLENSLFQDAEYACEKYIDIESAVKYYLHSELTGNCDSYWDIHCYKKRGEEKLYFGPVWDYDQSFLTNYRVPLYVATLDTQHGFAQSWFRRIMQTKAAQKVLERLWKQVKEEDLQQRLLDYADYNAALLQQSQALNYQRWNSLNRKVWFEDDLFGTFNEYIDFVKKFIVDRIAWYDGIVENLLLERLVLFPTSAPGNTPQKWQYTFIEPAAGWHLKDYNDKVAPWQTGLAPFGNEQNLQNTLWITGAPNNPNDEIYIRTYFDVSENELESIEKAYFTLWHDEDCQIYLNGTLALKRFDYITSYQTFEFDKTLLQTGSNTLAVKCINTVGGQLIDVGIFGLVKETTDIKNIPRPSGKYNWFVRDGILHISPTENKTSVKLYSVDGRLLTQQVATGDEIQISLPHHGIYLVNLSGEIIKVMY